MSKKRQYPKQTAANSDGQARLRQLVLANPPRCDACGEVTRPYTAAANDERWPEWRKGEEEAKAEGLEYIGMSKCTACGEVHQRFISGIIRG